MRKLLAQAFLIGLLLSSLICGPAWAQNMQGVVASPSPHSSGVTWTIIQHLSNFTCGEGTECTISAVTTTAGDLLIAYGAAYQNGSPAVYSLVTGDSTWTHCASAYASVSYIPSGSTDYENIDCAYILSAAGSTGDITFNWGGGGAASSDISFWEVRRSTGTAAYDTSNTLTSTTCGTSCAAPNLTLTGSSDFVLQATAEDGNPVSSISGPFSTLDIDNMNVYGSFAGAINQSGGTGPTWTISSTGTIGAAFSGIAFK